MASNIDPTCAGQLTTRGLNVQKSEVQEQFQAAKDEIEALQTGKGDATDVSTNTSDITALKAKTANVVAPLTTITVPTDEANFEDALTRAQDQLEFGDVIINVGTNEPAARAVGYVIENFTANRLTILGSFDTASTASTLFTFVNGNINWGATVTTTSAGIGTLFDIRNSNFSFLTTPTIDATGVLTKLIKLTDSHFIQLSTTTLSNLSNLTGGDICFEQRGGFSEFLGTMNMDRGGAADGGLGIYLHSGAAMDLRFAAAVLIKDWSTGIFVEAGSSFRGDASVTVQSCTNGLVAKYGSIIQAVGLTLTGNGTNADPVVNTVGNANSFIATTAV